MALWLLPHQRHKKPGALTPRRRRRPGDASLLPRPRPPGVESPRTVSPRRDRASPRPSPVPRHSGGYSSWGVGWRGIKSRVTLPVGKFWGPSCTRGIARKKGARATPGDVAHLQEPVTQACPRPATETPSVPSEEHQAMTSSGRGPLRRWRRRFRYQGAARRALQPSQQNLPGASTGSPPSSRR